MVLHDHPVDFNKANQQLSGLRSEACYTLTMHVCGRSTYFTNSSLEGRVSDAPVYRIVCFVQARPARSLHSGLSPLYVCSLCAGYLPTTYHIYKGHHLGLERAGSTCGQAIRPRARNGFLRDYHPRIFRSTQWPQPHSAPLEGISWVVSLAHPCLPLLLGNYVLNPDLLGPFLLKVADVPRVPQLGRDAQVLAAAHEGVGLAALAGSGDSVVGEELTLASGLCYESG